MNVGVAAMPSTGSWDTWKTTTLAITLASGTNTLRAVAGNATGANVDSLATTTA